MYEYESVHSQVVKGRGDIRSRAVTRIAAECGLHAESRALRAAAADA